MLSNLNRAIDDPQLKLTDIIQKVVLFILRILL